jgi:hypothetical protein
MGEDYRIFDNLLDSGQRRWGGYDRRAKDGYSTLLWAPGEVIVDRFGVPVDPAAPAGVYTLHIGLYREVSGQALSLPLVTDGQPTQQTSIQLGPIKVGGPPPDVVVDRPAPLVAVHQSFDHELTLLGYDLIGQNDRPLQQGADQAQDLNLTLYWQAETSPALDYTVFVHLRDQWNQIARQQDVPPANGRYPTSLWEAGEVIGNEVSLSLAGLSPGEYKLVVGLYDLATGTRLPLAQVSEASEQVDELHLKSITLQ